MMSKVHVISIVFLCGLMLGLSPSSNVDAAQNPVIIMTDVSGSMQEDIHLNTGQVEGDLKKAGALTQLLIGVGNALLPTPCDFGIYRVRYLGGNRDMYMVFLPLGGADSDMTNMIKGQFVTDFPVFNRRTPLAGSLRQLDERELGAMNGAVTILLISDGKETFYDLEDDMASAQGDVSADDRVKGPITEVKRLKEKYGANFSISTIFLGNAEEEPDGVKMLQEMAAMGEGQSWDGKTLLTGETLAESVAEALCKADIPPPPVTVAPPEAPVVLQNIHFEFDKSAITQQAAEILKNHAAWLAEHPEITVTIEGHCDERGTNEYNMALGERRAKSAKEFLMRMGIDGSRLDTISYGEERPIDPRHNEEAWAKNRRAEFVFEIQ